MAKKSNESLVDIIMATKNSAKFLSQALGSIKKQTFTSFRLIAVDKDSQDGTLEMLADFPGALVLQQSGSGFLDAWNKGINSGDAPWIAFLDSDDLWIPSKLSLQLKLAEERPELEFIYGRMAFFIEQGAVPYGFSSDVLARTHLIPTAGSCLVRRSAVNRLGLFDEKYDIAGDIEWFANLRDYCSVGAVDEVLLHKRIHESNLGQITSKALFQSELLKVMKRRLDSKKKRVFYGP